MRELCFSVSSEVFSFPVIFERHAQLWLGPRRRVSSTIGRHHWMA